MRKFMPLALAALLALLLLAGGGCGENKTTENASMCEGRYTSGKNTSDYIEINPNNTFTMVKNGQATSGSFDVEGEDLLLSAGSYSATITLSGDTITDEDGTRYNKDEGEDSGTESENERAEACRKAMIRFYLEDKPENFTSEIWVSGLEIDESMTDARGVINGAPGPGP